MRRLALIALLLTTTTAAAVAEPAAGTTAALDEEYGFRGIHFGDVIDEVKGLKKTAERGECEVAYKRAADKLEFVGVPLSGIEYSFQNDRLTVVSLLAKDADCAKLFGGLLKTYGPDATKLGEAATERKFWAATWESKRVKLDISGPEGCTVTITAPEEAILEERRCREDDRIKAGAGH